MNKLDEIFKDRPELLETKEVKELIAHAQKTHENLCKRYFELDNFEFKLLEIFAYSEMCLIGGLSKEKSFEKVVDLLDKL